MSKWRDISSSGVNNIILQAKEDNLRSGLTQLGVPDYLIYQYLKTNDNSLLYQYSREPEFQKEVFELTESLKFHSLLTMTGAVAKRHAHEAMERSNNLIMECCKELKHQYMHCSNTLKVPLLPSSKYKIYGVEDLHVPVVLKKSEISPDLPRMVDLEAKDLFQGRHLKKKKILLFGPPGVGKTTEIKMWLHGWCHKEEQSPLRKFRVVFYIDGAKLKPGTSLGEAVKSQCLPGNSKFSREAIEGMCQENQDEVLVILDNYTKWRKKGQACETTSLEDVVLLRNFLPLTLLVASTSGGVGDFREVYGNYDHVKVEGISQRSVSTYVHKVFKERKDFASKVEKSLRDTNQVPDMAASPILLSFRCQIVKWNKNPAVLGDLKTGSAFVDTLMDCLIKHGEDGDTHVRRYSDQPESPTFSQAEEPPVSPEIEEVTTSAVPPFRGLASFERTAPVRNQSTLQHDSISKDEILEQLSAVAFHCYLRNDHIEELHLSEDDFDVCGAQKTVVIKEGCRLGLLVKSCNDELTPSSPKAAEGRIIRFFCAPFQQRLAAKHFSKLLQGKDEEKKSFKSSLEKVGSIDDALSLRNLLLFACGESRETASLIISHVVDLTRAFAEDMFNDPRHEEGLLRQAHGLYQYMIEYILDLNYEARSGGSLNDILSPLVTRLRILSPTVIMTRALAYLLEHSATPQACNLGEVNIEVFDVQRDIINDLPIHKHIQYDYQEHAPLTIEMSAFEDLGATNPVHPPLCRTTTCTFRKLSIRVDRKKKKAAIAAQFPGPPADTNEEDLGLLPFTENEVPFTDAAREYSCLPVSVSDNHDLSETDLHTTSKQLLQEATSNDHVLKFVLDHFGKSPSEERLYAIQEQQLPSQQTEAGTSSGAMQAANRARPRRVIEVLYDDSSYKVGRFIAYGGFAEVHEATWKEKKVALKRIRLIESRMTETWKREININALVSHPNIVKLFAYSMYRPGTTLNYCADLLLEFIDGFTLSDAVFENKVGYLETKNGKLRTAQKLADAIAHIHDNRLTHSDIKPDNILIRKADNEPFICDFGLGHGVTRSALSKYTPGFRRGVPKWYPPESFLKRGKGQGYRISYEGDVWSLACTLLEVFTRKRVWDNIEDDIDLRERLQEEDVTPEIIADVESDIVKDALRCCFNKTPEKRPTARELALIFQRALPDQAAV